MQLLVWYETNTTGYKVGRGDYDVGSGYCEETFDKGLLIWKAWHEEVKLQNYDLAEVQFDLNLLVHCIFCFLKVLLKNTNKQKNFSLNLWLL